MKEKAAPKSIPRRDGYFGIHLGLHPSREDTALGLDVTEDAVRDFLRRVRPDYVQYDCVGVPGYAGYPTKVGWPAPGIVNDSLAVWREMAEWSPRGKSAALRNPRRPGGETHMKNLLPLELGAELVGERRRTEP
jgi:hypothetical protein